MHRYCPPGPEAEYIAGWIARDIAGYGRKPTDFALVAPHKVAGYGQRLAAALASHGISLRNDDVWHGEMRLQDMLKHEAARLLLGVLRLADVWLEVTTTLARIDGTIDDDARRLGDDLAPFHARPAHRWQRCPSGRRARPRAVVLAVGEDRLPGNVKSSYPGDNTIVILRSLTERLRHVVPGVRDQAQAFTDVEVADAVMLMTIHRQQGTRVPHGVLPRAGRRPVVGSPARPRRVGLGLLRRSIPAAHRLIFTSMSPAARPGKIAALYRMLDETDVPKPSSSDLLWRCCTTRSGSSRLRCQTATHSVVPTEPGMLLVTHRLTGDFLNAYAQRAIPGQ